MTYSIPPQTRIGHVHLKVSDIEKSLQFYQGMLGFEITQRYGSNAVFISAGGYHHSQIFPYQPLQLPSANYHLYQPAILL